MKADAGEASHDSDATSEAYNGKDWQERMVSYSGCGTFYGGPYVNGHDSPQSHAKPTGLLSMMLPQGTFSCTASGLVPVTGVVRSLPAEVDRIGYQVNDGPEVTLCTNCGKDPTFSFHHRVPVLREHHPR